MNSKRQIVRYILYALHMARFLSSFAFDENHFFGSIDFFDHPWNIKDVTSMIWNTVKRKNIIFISMHIHECFCHEMLKKSKML